nr:transposase [Exiguobacterium aurantiacum]
METNRTQLEMVTLDERVFANAKEKHGMRWTRYRGLEKVSMQAMLTFAALNLKKMAG